MNITYLLPKVLPKEFVCANDGLNRITHDSTSVCRYSDLVAAAGAAVAAAAAGDGSCRTMDTCHWRINWGPGSNSYHSSVHSDYKLGTWEQ
jgi:hypothetical protein